MFSNLLAGLLTFVPLLEYGLRLKKDKWHKWLLLIPPLVFFFLFVFKVLDLNIQLGTIQYNLNLLLALLVNTGICFLYYGLVSKKEIKKTDYLIFPLTLVIDILIKMLFGWLTGNGFNFYNTWYINEHLLIFNISYLFIYLTTIFTLFLGDWQKRIRASKIILLVFGYFVGIMLLVLEAVIDMLTTKETINSTAVLMIVLLFFLVIVIVLFLVYELNEFNHQQQRLKKATYKKVSEYYDKQILVNQEELIKLKHDMNNFLEVIRLKDEKSYQELKEKVNKYNAVYFCKDELLNKILVLKASEAKKAGIEFNAKISLDGDVGLNDIDKISLFTNIIDNAITAASTSEQKLINLEITLENKMLHISLVNSCDQLQTKKDKIYHGKGREIVQDIVKKNNGNTYYHYANKLYSLQIVLNLEGR